MTLVCCLHSIAHQSRAILFLRFDSKDLTLLAPKLDFKNCFLEFYSNGDLTQPMTRYKLGQLLLRIPAESKIKFSSHLSKKDLIGRSFVSRFEKCDC